MSHTVLQKSVKLDSKSGEFLRNFLGSIQEILLVISLQTFWRISQEFPEKFSGISWGKIPEKFSGIPQDFVYYSVPQIIRKN